MSDTTVNGATADAGDAKGAAQEKPVHAIVERKSSPLRAPLAFLVMAGALVATGWYQSPAVALTILNMSLISAIMAMGLNLQWGYAGLFNAGVMGFVALGGLAAVLVAHPPVMDAIVTGGRGMALSLLILLAIITTIVFLATATRGRVRSFLIFVTIVVGYAALRPVFGAAVDAVESVDPTRTGFLGGLGMPITLSWIAGAFLAASVAWIIGKVALGLRTDYLAIATLGISEIVVSILRNEEWLARGVKNVSDLPRPVPYEIDLQQEQWFIDMVARVYATPLAQVAEGAEREAALRQFIIEGSGHFVKLAYAGLFTVVLLILLALCVRALNSPWGRMMRAIRDNEDAASAMGKDVKKRHLQVFILGAAMMGIAGAMMTTLDGQFTPGSYQPLRFTFLIWVMVIVGGSGNNLGAVLGGFVVWFTWVQAEPAGAWIVAQISAGMDPTTELYRHLQDIAAPFRLFVMGFVLLMFLRFAPRGILPEKVRHS